MPLERRDRRFQAFLPHRIDVRPRQRRKYEPILPGGGPLPSLHQGVFTQPHGEVFPKQARARIVEPTAVSEDVSPVEGPTP